MFIIRLIKLAIHIAAINWLLPTVTLPESIEKKKFKILRMAKQILFTIAVAMYIGLAYGNNEGINLGASTSGHHDDVHCEMQEYASRLVLLMTAQDARADNLTNMFNHRFDELEAFHDEVYTIISSVEFGSRAGSEVSEAERIERLEYFSKAVN